MPWAAPSDVLDITFRMLRFFPPPSPSELSVADVDTDVPGSVLHDRLTPMNREGAIADGPALTLQATRFACSGIALGMRMAHALIDGVGAARTCHHRALPMDAAV